jgi:serine/threonine protein phosphatase PrpC
VTATLPSIQTGVVAAATTSRKPVNQDACALVCNHSLPAAGVVVADGLGSHFGSELAAAAACAHVSGELARHDACRIDWPAIFCAACDAIGRAVRHAAAVLPDGTRTANVFGTTLICGLDHSDRLIAAYTGNGAVIHLRGDFNVRPPSVLLPWTALNYLNPHSQPVDGHNMLYKWLAPGASHLQARPTVVEVRKDDDIAGDLLVVCSDGVASQDQIQVGTDEAGRIWSAGGQHLPLLYTHLSEYLDGPDQSATALHALLDRYLQALHDGGLVDDDCTVGVIVTAQAIRFHAARRARDVEEARA